MKTTLSYFLALERRRCYDFMGNMIGINWLDVSTPNQTWILLPKDWFYQARGIILKAKRTELYAKYPV